MIIGEDDVINAYLGDRERAYIMYSKTTTCTADDSLMLAITW